MKIPKDLLKTLAECKEKTVEISAMRNGTRHVIVALFTTERVVKRKMSVREAAKKLGITPTYLLYIECGRRALSENMIEKFLKF